MVNESSLAGTKQKQTLRTNTNQAFGTIKNKNKEQKK